MGGKVSSGNFVIKFMDDEFGVSRDQFPASGSVGASVDIPINWEEEAAAPVRTLVCKRIIHSSPYAASVMFHVLQSIYLPALVKLQSSVRVYDRREASFWSAV